MTERMLEVLGRHGARATFNVLGERVEGREALLRRTLAAGHELGNHGFFHEPLARRPLATLRQLRATAARLEAATGVEPRLFRAPFGAVSLGTVLAARLAGMTTVGWDVDPRDFEEPGAEVIRARIVSGVGPGSIVLLHDDRPELEQSALALDEALPMLRQRGYTCVTVSELLGRASPGPESAGRPSPERAEKPRWYRGSFVRRRT